jgi:hypothetical protein
MRVQVLRAPPVSPVRHIQVYRGARWLSLEHVGYTPKGDDICRDAHPLEFVTDLGKFGFPL